MGGSHYNLVNGLTGGNVPTVDKEMAPEIFRALHQAIKQGLSVAMTSAKAALRLLRQKWRLRVGLESR